MLSKFAIRRLTDDFSSSMYMFSISLDTNFGNLRSLDLETKTNRMNCGDNQRPLVARGESPRSICREVCEQGTPTNQMTNYSFPLCNAETLLLASHRITTWYSANFTVSCMHLHFIHLSICKWPSSHVCVHNYKHSRPDLS